MGEWAVAWAACAEPCPSRLRKGTSCRRGGGWGEGKRRPPTTSPSPPRHGRLRTAGRLQRRKHLRETRSPASGRGQNLRRNNNEVARHPGAMAPCSTTGWAPPDRRLLAIGLYFEHAARRKKLTCAPAHRTRHPGPAAARLPRLLARALSFARPLPQPPALQKASRVLHIALLTAIAVLVNGPLAVWSGGRAINVFDWFAIPSPLGEMPARKALEIAQPRREGGALPRAAHVWPRSSTPCSTATARCGGSSAAPRRRSRRKVSPCGTAR